VSSPSSSTPARKARKRTSDEFEHDYSGAVSKMHHQRTPSGSVIEKPKEEHSSARKHRSLGVGVGLPTTTVPSRDKQRDRRWESASSNSPLVKPERHARHTSTGSTSSSHGDTHPARRVHTADFSHLPPSPSSSSIQHFLRHVGSNGAMAATVAQPAAKEVHHHSSPNPNVAHSLLRGTQESSSDLDSETLRRLDGLYKAGARVRSSVSSTRPGSSGRPGSSSRSNTPARSSTQWEGVSSDKESRRSSAHIRDSMIAKDKDQTPNAQRVGLGLYGGEEGTETAAGALVGSSDENPLGQDKTAKKQTARPSYAGKRGSASSTTYASTPTTSSRDSASLSAATSLTSASAQSNRQSIGKGKRNSGGSDSSATGESGLLKERVTMSPGEQADAIEHVPPVPPLPKDLAPYLSPPSSARGASFEGECETAVSNASLAPDRPATAGSPTPQGYTSSSSAGAGPQKAPSRKWSLLGMKLSGAPPSPAVPPQAAKAPPVVSFHLYFAPFLSDPAS
jgi:dual specificity tyrosine-phosphorylation-regulated kinase 2/3/4